MKKLFILAALLIILAGCNSTAINTNEDFNNQQNNNTTIDATNAEKVDGSVPQSDEYIDYTDAPQYVGSNKTVRGRIDNIYYSQKSDTTFINFCPSYKTCPFSSVVFSSDKSKFGNLFDYEGKTVEITGLIKTYQGRAEIILNSPTQIKIID